jgi:hypothetical protein
MAKKKNQATMLRTLLLVTAIFAVSALAMAGLLTYYATVVGTVTVEQGVVLEIYNTSGQVLGKATYNTNVSLSANVVAGSNLTTFKYNNSEVWYLNISYLADGSVPAPLKIRTRLESNFSGLFEEIVKFGVIILNSSNLQELYKVEINDTGVYLYSGNILRASGNWSDTNKATITYYQFSFTVERNNTSKELLLYGNAIVLPQLGGSVKSVIFKPFLVWNVATQPGTYTITFSVEPAKSK